MKALLLAAGQGTRLRPLTIDTPKCLMPVRGKPLLEYWFELLFESGIKEALINLHYLSEQVEAYIATSPYKKNISVIFEKELLGTGGTLLNNRAFFKDEQIILIHADNYSIFRLNDFIYAHEMRPEKCDMTMMTFKSDTPESCGIVELDRDGVVCAFHEKIKNPPGNLANGAVYILEPTIFDFLSQIGENKYIDFSTEVLPHFTGHIFTFFNDCYHRDIGTKESYQKAQELL